MLTKIISGGQTGADRAALDVAIEFKIPHSGWIPKGRRTEDGRLPDRYLLRETKNIGYPQRTELNILESDATLILSHGKLVGGSRLCYAGSIVVTKNQYLLNIWVGDPKDKRRYSFCVNHSLTRVAKLGPSE